MLKRTITYILLLVALLLAITACQKEKAGEAMPSDLAFSCDTVAFDTVFTQMGSTTQQLKVYNHGESEITLTEVTLRNGYSSRFRLNVDGDTNMVARNLTIPAGDSLFVFVRANINPNSATEPFLIEDAIQFKLSTGKRQVALTAYGRNAVYHVPTDTIHYADGTYPTDGYGHPYAYSVIDCEHWRHDLPHVILAYAVVDSRNTLHLQAGDELYFCNDAVLWVYDSATLDVHGSTAQPVLFTSVRHDGWYDYLPGQWGHIWLSAGSRDNVIDYALIENGYAGLQADSCASVNPTLTISNTQIRNCSLAGMVLQTAHVTGRNLLVTNCGTATVAMQYGGSYNFEGCTFADYWKYDSRTNPSVYVTNTRDYNNIHYIWPMFCTLKDCIIYGSRSQGELYTDLDQNVSATLEINHCLVRGGTWDEDPKFVDVENGDYHLSEDSPALGIGYLYPDQEKKHFHQTK